MAACEMRVKNAAKKIQLVWHESWLRRVKHRSSVKIQRHVRGCQGRAKAAARKEFLDSLSFSRKCVLKIGPHRLFVHMADVTVGRSMKALLVRYIDPFKSQGEKFFILEDEVMKYGFGQLATMPKHHKEAICLLALSQHRTQNVLFDHREVLELCGARLFIRLQEKKDRIDVKWLDPRTMDNGMLAIMETELSGLGFTEDLPQLQTKTKLQISQLILTEHLLDEFAQRKISHAKAEAKTVMAAGGIRFLVVMRETGAGNGLQASFLNTVTCRSSGIFTIPEESLGVFTLSSEVNDLEPESKKELLRFCLHWHVVKKMQTMKSTKASSSTLFKRFDPNSDLSGPQTFEADDLSLKQLSHSVLTLRFRGSLFFITSYQLRGMLLFKYYDPFNSRNCLLSARLHEGIFGLKTSIMDNIDISTPFLRKLFRSQKLMNNTIQGRSKSPKLSFFSTHLLLQFNEFMPQFDISQSAGDFELEGTSLGDQSMAMMLFDHLRKAVEPVNAFKSSMKDKGLLMGCDSFLSHASCNATTLSLSPICQRRDSFQIVFFAGGKRFVTELWERNNNLDVHIKYFDTVSFVSGELVLTREKLAFLNLVSEFATLDSRSKFEIARFCLHSHVCLLRSKEKKWAESLSGMHHFEKPQSQSSTQISFRNGTVLFLLTIYQQHEMMLVKYYDTLSSSERFLTVRFRENPSIGISVHHMEKLKLSFSYVKRLITSEKLVRNISCETKFSFLTAHLIMEYKELMPSLDNSNLNFDLEGTALGDQSMMPGAATTWLDLFDPVFHGGKAGVLSAGKCCFDSFAVKIQSAARRCLARKASLMRPFFESPLSVLIKWKPPCLPITLSELAYRTVGSVDWVVLGNIGSLTTPRVLLTWLPQQKNFEAQLRFYHNGKMNIYRNIQFTTKPPSPTAYKNASSQLTLKILTAMIAKKSLLMI